ncbi:hypothetical protein [Mycobacterium sp.]|uniref:hypothetical protein n=1 Tax=Mycobacterium sp. TaxID=1785 RepID=UPI003F95B893
MPSGLATVIERAMARDPAQRFDHANSMRAALTGAHPASIPVRAATSDRPVTRVRPATRVLKVSMPAR